VVRNSVAETGISDSLPPTARRPFTTFTVTGTLVSVCRYVPAREATSAAGIGAPMVSAEAAARSAPPRKMSATPWPSTSEFALPALQRIAIESPCWGKRPR
jgi:hypothetical protein